jgi:hypothetical protein
VFVFVVAMSRCSSGEVIIARVPEGNEFCLD